MLAIGDVQGNINILKIGESLLRFDEHERREVDEFFRREKDRETNLGKKRKKNITKKKFEKQEEKDEFDTEKLTNEFFNDLDIKKNEGEN